MNIKELKNYIAEDVLSHHLSEIVEEWGEGYDDDTSKPIPKIRKLAIKLDQSGEYSKLLDLFLKRDTTSEELGFQVWETYEDHEDETLGELMGDMYDYQIETWAKRLKIYTKGCLDREGT